MQKTWFSKLFNWCAVLFCFLFVGGGIVLLVRGCIVGRPEIRNVPCPIGYYRIVDEDDAKRTRKAMGRHAVGFRSASDVRDSWIGVVVSDDVLDRDLFLEVAASSRRNLYADGDRTTKNGARQVPYGTFEGPEYFGGATLTVSADGRRSLVSGSAWIRPPSLHGRVVKLSFFADAGDGARDVVDGVEFYARQLRDFDY